jgi:hypothetical protein
LTGGRDRPIGDRPAQVVLALLIVAFKLTPFFSPAPAGHVKQEHISFKLAKADAVTVTIINAKGDQVATLVQGYPVARYKPLSLRWGGRLGSARGYAVLEGPDKRKILVPTNRGRLAPAGEYRVRVSLRKQDRSVLSPRSFTLARR